MYAGAGELMREVEGADSVYVCGGAPPESYLFVIFRDLSWREFRERFECGVSKMIMLAPDVRLMVRLRAGLNRVSRCCNQWRLGVVRERERCMTSGYRPSVAA